MLNQIPLLYRWLALAALVGVAMLYAAMAMHAHDSKAQAAFVAGVKAEGNKQLEHTAQIITQQKAITDETANDYAAGLIALRRDYDSKLRERASGRQVPAVPATACGTDAAPADNGIAAQVTSAAKRTDPLSVANGDTPLELCAETTLQLVSLQQWIKQQARLQ